MGAGPLIIELITVFILTGFLLNKVIWQLASSTFNCYNINIHWMTFYNRCKLERNKIAISLGQNSTELCEEPGGYVPDRVLLSLWRIVYWTAQCLTWLVSNIIQFLATFHSSLIYNTASEKILFISSQYY
uniref:Anoctamin n=1 Tax=Heterorhabditis bacteriophora TaxID=37862 RepID=A0A1I7X105_HETBA